MRFAVVSLFIVSLAGCAANVVQLEHANSVATQTTEVVKNVKAYVTAVQSRRRDAVIALVASDGSCKWGSKIVVDSEWKASSPPAKRIGLCDLTNVPKDRQVSIDIRPIQPEALKALTTAIAGVAAYHAALAEVLAEDPAAARQDVDTALSILTTATADLNRIAGSKTIDLGPLFNDRAKAVTDLAGTLIDLLQTELKVENVRDVVAATNTVGLIDGLNSALMGLSKLQDANSANYALLGLSKVYGYEAATTNFSQRRYLVREIANADDAFANAHLGQIGALNETVGEMRKQDAALRNALAGDFSPAERKRIARENIKQVFGILSKIAALFPAL